MLKLCLLGPPVTLDDEHEVRLISGKAQALLFYLAAQPGYIFSRSQLAALLWENGPDGRIRTGAGFRDVTRDTHT
jgi:DNA-binding SARP family transcriptional activator